MCALFQLFMSPNIALIWCAAGPVQAVKAHLQLQDWRAAGKKNSSEVVYLGLFVDCQSLWEYIGHQQSIRASCTCDLLGTSEGLYGSVCSSSSSME